MSTSNTYNTGIAHLARNDFSAACRNRRAHYAIKSEQFATDTHRCKRCEAIFAKWQAKKEKEAAV